MDLDLFKNLEANANTNENINDFMKELNKFLAEEQNTKNETIVENFNEHEKNPNRKENHLYLVTEDRNGEVYLWDFTERAEKEFLEKELPAEVLVFATEGAMLQYKNGEYILYSPDGFDIVDNAEDF